MARWPAIFGVRGFDFGLRPALSLAVDPRPSRQILEEPWPPLCPKPPTLDVVISGYTSCFCFTDNLGGIYEFTAHTGITGAHSIPIITPGTAAWQGVIGTVTIQKYTDLCVTPDGAPFDVDALIDILCDPSTAPDVLSAGITLASSPPNISALFFTGAGSCPCVFGAAMTNANTCGNTGALVTTVTVDLP